MLLIKENLYNHITDDPPDPVINDWTENYQKGNVLINFCIEDIQVVYVENE